VTERLRDDLRVDARREEGLRERLAEIVKPDAYPLPVRAARESVDRTPVAEHLETAYR
jgi:hypothetical protein